ncbi:hypothetical protein DKP76_07180 [Falsochrobactrum shanghaiense]|uniref:Uncharacterized protein n=1 Tax=Falsochrobactrum shanghaiense TaxID=2201899 RepID=A0A316JA42_9HYPH|nr:hypothetical protein [Falsochrobactrum shanghaiense]PWL18837.1 hypothetical protein DKP76_07180 [Falsochrobactrum shanghaiense]
MSKNRRGSMADQLQALKAYRSRPEEKFEPLQTNWAVATANDNADPEEVADMRYERDWRQTPSVQEIMRQVATDDIERNSDGQIVRIGRLRFSDGRLTEKGYVTGIDGEVIQADIRMPAGAMMGMRDKPDRVSGGDANPQEIKASNQYFEDMLSTAPHRYIPNGKRRNGENYTAEQSKAILAEAYANTDMEKVTYTHFPKGLPCGSPKAADSFLGMRKTTCAGGGGEKWEDTLSAMIDRDVWFDALQELKDRDRDALDAALEAKTYKDVGQSIGMAGEYSRRKGGKRALLAANDNLAAAIKKYAA